jgi:hypothetical protein
MSYKTHGNGSRESHSGVVCPEQRVAEKGLKFLWRSDEDRHIRTRG